LLSEFSNLIPNSGKVYVGFDIFGTYQYAPAAFAGQSDAQAYRGVIEGHNFGGSGIWNIKVCHV